MEKLDFLQSWSIEEFKAMKNAKKIEIKRNETTMKCFFTYGGGLNGAVSTRIENGVCANPVISEVCSPDTGDVFLLLHQQGEGATLLNTL